MRSEQRCKISCIVFWIVIYSFMCAAVVTLLARQILVKHFHLDNELVRCIYSGNRVLISEAESVSGKIREPIDWNALYPYDANKDTEMTDMSETADDPVDAGFVNRYENAVNEVKKDIGNYVEDYHPWRTYMKWISGTYDMLVMGKKPALAKENIYVARDKYLYTYSAATSDRNYSDGDIEYLAETVADFYAFLKDRKIGFIYAAASSKPCPFEDSSACSTDEKVVSNKYRFLRELKKRKIPEFDLSELMPHDPDEWYKLYYETDMHWNDRGGLWASGVLAKYLNDNAGFSFDLDLFKTDSYFEDTREKYYRGGTARSVSPLEWKREPLTRFVPKFETSYAVMRYSEDGVEERHGDLIEVFFNNDVYDELGSLPERDVYSGIRGDHRFVENDDLYTIVNSAAPDNKDKKILMLRDSYTSYVIPYLSADVGEVDLIYMPKFTGSIRKYIEETEPDAVIMLQYETNIAPKSAVNETQGYHFNLF